VIGEVEGAQYERSYFTGKPQPVAVELHKQKVVRVDYDGQSLGNQRIDLLVDDKIILEIKACTKIIPIYRDQVISYLKTTDKRLGLILNFGRQKLEIKRVVHNF
jgi:GxxExxY protein